MPSRKISAWYVAPAMLAALLIGVLFRPDQIHAQHSAPPLAQVGPGAPLPVYVVNDPAVLPDGFVPGSSWNFTNWLTPSGLSFTATVEKVQGGWALLALSGNVPSGTRWYYIPQMPGAWQPQ